MSYEIIDIDKWYRKDNYLFFQSFLSSWNTITVKLTCTNAYNKAKKNKESFFIYYLYSILKAANEITEFKVRKDKQGRVILNKRIDIITPIHIPNKTFYTVRISYIENFPEFYKEAVKIIKDIPINGNPYGAEELIFEEGIYDVIHISAIPNLSFTNYSFSILKEGTPAYYPLGIIGKAEWDNGELKMPYSFCIDHALIDGTHVANYVAKIEANLNLF